MNHVIQHRNWRSFPFWRGRRGLQPINRQTRGGDSSGGSRNRWWGYGFWTSKWPVSVHCGWLNSHASPSIPWIRHWKINRRARTQRMRLALKFSRGFPFWCSIFLPSLVWMCSFRPEIWRKNHSGSYQSDCNSRSSSRLKNETGKNNQYLPCDLQWGSQSLLLYIRLRIMGRDISWPCSCPRRSRLEICHQR